MARKWESLEKEWKKVKPLTMTETGVSAKLRAIQTALKEYSRDFVKTTSGPDSAKNDDERFQNGFDAHVKSAKSLLTIDPQVAKNSKTKAWIQQLIDDLEAEKKFWDGNPCQARHKVRFTEDVAQPDPEKNFKSLAAKLERARDYHEAANMFAIGAETCFPGQKSNESKLKAFAGAFKALIQNVSAALQKTPPDLGRARAEVNRLKTAPPQLARDFPEHGAILQKAVEDAIFTPLDGVVTEFEQKQTQ